MGKHNLKHTYANTQQTNRGNPYVPCQFLSINLWSSHTIYFRMRLEEETRNRYKRYLWMMKSGLKGLLPLRVARLFFNEHLPLFKYICFALNTRHLSDTWGTPDPRDGGQS